MKSSIFECPCCLQVQANTLYHIQAHMQFFIHILPGCSSAFINKFRGFHHVSRVQHQLKKIVGVQTLRV
jgi:hypothetical protein